MSDEIIIPAIADDGTLFPIEKMEAHRIAQQHLAISVFVFSGTKLLIQQRAKGKYHCPGRWANTCCSHPHWQESVEDAARRRVDEELGFTVPLSKTAVIDYKADVGGGLTENERVHVFKGEADETTLKSVSQPGRGCSRALGRGGRSASPPRERARYPVPVVRDLHQPLE
jgi:isopentenyl-diphosphate delta-isomerase